MSGSPDKHTLSRAGTFNVRCGLALVVSAAVLAVFTPLGAHVLTFGSWGLTLLGIVQGSFGLGQLAEARSGDAGANRVGWGCLVAVGLLFLVFGLLTYWCW